MNFQKFKKMLFAVLVMAGFTVANAFDLQKYSIQSVNPGNNETILNQPRITVYIQFTKQIDEKTLNKDTVPVLGGYTVTSVSYDKNTQIATVRTKEEDATIDKKYISINIRPSNIKDINGVSLGTDGAAVVGTFHTENNEH